MSQETTITLNTLQLIGFTDQLGKAWHYKADAQGTEPNHYPAAIPVNDVRRRLFYWTADPARVFVELPATFDNMTNLNEAGEPVRMVLAQDRKAIVRSDTDHTLGIFTDGYEPHQYDQWLVDNVEVLLSGGLEVGSAGLLKGGAVAYVQVRLPEPVSTQDGLIVPFLLARTSFDGSLATAYSRAVTRVVCDNTLSAGSHEARPTTKVKHTRYSQLKIGDARAAMELIETAGADYIAEMDLLLAQDVTDTQFGQIITAVFPDAPPLASQRTHTMIDKKRAQVRNLWFRDTRVSSVRNSAWGVLQAFNTWQQHEQTVRGSSRADRNMLATIDGTFAGFDKEVKAATQLVLAR